MKEYLKQLVLKKVKSIEVDESYRVYGIKITFTDGTFLEIVSDGSEGNWLEITIK